MHTLTLFKGAKERTETRKVYLAELHDDVHHVALLIALIILNDVGVVQAVQDLHLILGLQTTHHSGKSHYYAVP